MPISFDWGSNVTARRSQGFCSLADVPAVGAGRHSRPPEVSGRFAAVGPPRNLSQFDLPPMDVEIRVAIARLEP